MRWSNEPKILDRDKAHQDLTTCINGGSLFCRCLHGDFLCGLSAFLWGNKNHKKGKGLKDIDGMYHLHNVYKMAAAFK